MVVWNPNVADMPRDEPVLALCRDACASPVCGYHTNSGTTLCVYHAHVEGLSHVSDGPHVVEWGGGWADCEEDGGASLPDWWFRTDSEFEIAANPVAWCRIAGADV